jgi:hypothetical protein
VGGQDHAPAAFTAWKDPVPIVQEGGWAPGPVWTCAKNFALTGIFLKDAWQFIFNKIQTVLGSTKYI